MNRFLIILFSSFIIFSCKKKTEDEPQEPVPSASFSMSTNQAKTGVSVNFTNTSQNGFSYLWDFGDGQTSTSEHVSHSWDLAGTYDVKLTAYSESSEKQSEHSDQIYVTNLNEGYEGYYNWISGQCGFTNLFQMTSQGTSELVMHDYIENQHDIQLVCHNTGFDIPYQTFTHTQNPNAYHSIQGSGYLSNDTLYLDYFYNWVNTTEPWLNTSNSCLEKYKR